MCGYSINELFGDEGIKFSPSEVRRELARHGVFPWEAMPWWDGFSRVSGADVLASLGY